jgi:hypothetical protein
MTQLSDAQMAEARVLYYKRGHNLGAVARSIGCSIYDLSPWLYMEDPSLRARLAELEAEDAAKMKLPPEEDLPIWTGPIPPE